MVHENVATTGSSPDDFASEEISATTSETARATSINQSNTISSLQVVRESLLQQGVPRQAAKIISQSWRTGTCKQYGVYIKQWCDFCSRRKIDYRSPSTSVNSVLEFLTILYNRGLSYSSINTARSALGSLCFDKDTIGMHPLIRRFMKGIFQERPALPRYNGEMWDVSKVMTLLRSWSPGKYLSLKQLTFKLIMLLLLASTQRGQTVLYFLLKNLRFQDGKAIFVIGDLLKTSRPGSHIGSVVFEEYEEHKLCVVRYLKQYIKRTEFLRHGEDRLLISYQKPYNAVGRDTLSRWTRTVMTLAGIDTKIFKPHSTREASTSKAFAQHKPLQDILDSAGWKSERTFHKFYRRNIQ